jgi:hypothetical protein
MYKHHTGSNQKNKAITTCALNDIFDIIISLSCQNVRDSSVSTGVKMGGSGMDSVIYAGISVCIYVYLYEYLCEYTYTYTYISVCIYMYLYVYVNM